MNERLNSKQILENQLQEVTDWHTTPLTPDEPQSFEELASLVNHYNFSLWHEEDKARDTEATDEVIAVVKRKIDKFNQQRNDTIEKIDEALILIMQNEGVTPKSDARLNSETPGSIFDRLSINALKIFHMKEETERTDASSEHLEKCNEKLSVLEAQRKDLSNCLFELLEDLEKGEKRMIVYRQMKMYNDPTLNPVLYKKK